MESRFEFSLTEASAIKVTESQCKDCKNEFGFDGCKVFGKAPNKYAFPSAKVPCPERSMKDEIIKNRIKGSLYGFAIGDAMGLLLNL